jgi:hypothetical protein
MSKWKRNFGDIDSLGCWTAVDMKVEEELLGKEIFC